MDRNEETRAAGLSRRRMLGVLGGLGLAGWETASLLAGSCGPPPPAKRQRWKAAESFPPLPLPATPLRRSEKKRPPAPPTLLGKLQYGKVVTATDAQGRRTRYRDWTTDPGDAPNLLRRCNHDLGLQYRSQETDFARFSFTPEEMAVLFLTGHEGFRFEEKEDLALRRYLHDGGALLGDACCGMIPYREAFLREIHRLFPERKMKILPADHPVYTAYHTLERVGYQDADKGDFEAPPVLEGISIGCREAVLLSQYDLSCGWDGHRHDRGRRVWPAEGAVRLGVNMIAYWLATYSLGRYLATTTRYHEDAPRADGGLVIGQIVHGGDWDPNPSGLMNLIKHAVRRSSMALRFDRKAVNLAEEDVRGCPVLYMTGHDDFAWSPREAARLRSYLEGGGVLLADACCGRSAFDTAFRRELGKVLPGRPLAPVAPDHPLYRMVVDASAVEGTPYLTAKRRGAGLGPLARPAFEGVALGGALGVVYSSLGLGCGWEDEACPYCLGYAPASARDLGLNALAYALSH